MSQRDAGKPFACLEPGCGMTFSNDDHLSVHKKKHEMSLALTPGLKPGSLLMFTDQTPTPTKFLRNCEEIGLFNELRSNPFEEAFKTASDSILIDGKVIDPSQVALMLSNRKATVSSLVASLAQSASSTSTISSAILRTTQAAALGEPPPPPLPGPDDDIGSSVDNTPDGMPVVVDGDGDGDVEMTSPDAVMDVSDDATSSQQASQVSASVMSPPAASRVDASSSPKPSSSVASSVIVIAPAPCAPGEGTPPHTPPCLLKVMIQMPSGEFVPIQIPASQLVSQAALPAITKVVGVTTVAAMSAAAPSTTTALTKQRLKAALQQSSLKALGAVTRPVMATTPRQTLLKNPILVPSITVSPPGVIPSPTTPTPPPPRLQVQDIDTSTPIKVRRLSSVEESEEEEEGGADGGDDRRRKFLERNRAAAARCRAKKKMWMSGLELKADELHVTNSRLQTEVVRLRNEVADLKSLLLAHKDCPITLQQNAIAALQGLKTEPLSADPLSPSVVVAATFDATTELANVKLISLHHSSDSSSPVILLESLEQS